MAKKKSGTRHRKSKKKQGSPFLMSVKRIFLWAFTVVACFIGILFIYNFFVPVSKNYSKTEQTEVKREGVPSPSNIPSRTSSKTPEITSKKGASTYQFPARAEIPKLQNERKEQIIRHEGYTVSYNSDHKIANWVAYELTGQEAKSKKAERSNKFVPDPMVNSVSATNEDYTRTGFDRGHLAPAGDMKWSAKAMRESFYLSNICPQEPALNRGIWKDLEEQARLWAIEDGSLLIVTGPVLTDDMRRLGKNGVGVSRAFYKVICTILDGTPQAIGFLLDNKDYGKTTLRSVAIPVDSVEKVTGIDFFPSLPDELERRMEAIVNWDSWSF